MSGIVSSVAVCRDKKCIEIITMCGLTKLLVHG